MKRNNDHIAVFDIGKTNKKLLIFDDQLDIVDVEKINIEEYEKNGVRYDQLEKIENWFLDTLKKKAGSFNIRAISVSAHGATFVTLDDKGNPALPVLSYTTDPGETFHEEFYHEFGSPEDLQQTTATPNFNLLTNVAKGIWFARQHFGREFEKVRHILNLPQYFTYRLTGRFCADPTYTGCHTYLWDFNKNDWSDVARDMGLLPFLPREILKPWEVAGRLRPDIARRTELGEDTLVTAGIHDSNASLLPHLITAKEEFVLNSTGTWCVIMHQQNQVRFEPDELGKVVFFNISPFSKPVKTAIFMGGLEFEAYDELIRELHPTAVSEPVGVELYRKILNTKDLFLLPGVTRGTGQFPESEPRIIEKGTVFHLDDIRKGRQMPDLLKDPGLAYAVLNLSLAIQTRVSLDRADMKNGLPLFTEGGFSQNKDYNRLVASFYPDSSLYLTSLDEATAFGAAILGKSAIENKDPNAFKNLIDIQKTPVREWKLSGLKDYEKKFLSLI